jgi:hypothetical protein
VEESSRHDSVRRSYDAVAGMLERASYPQETDTRRAYLLGRCQA